VLDGISPPAALDIARTYLVSMAFLQVRPQVQEQRDSHTHYDHRAYTQDQKPPDHPHSRLG
jgi:hypothetical protein